MVDEVDLLWKGETLVPGDTYLEQGVLFPDNTDADHGEATDVERSKYAKYLRDMEDAGIEPRPICHLIVCFRK